MADKSHQKNASSWSSPIAKFLSKGLRLPKELDYQRTHVAKTNVAMLVAMSFFSSILKIFSGEVLAIV